MATAMAAGLASPAAIRVNVAIIGLRGRGRALANVFLSQPDVSIEYLIDVDERVIGPVAAAVEKAGGKRPKTGADMRVAFDDKDIDAVVIATPDHWHAPATILACDAGKDVYVEKPCSHNILEGRLMVEAARRNKRVVQHGTQSRSRVSTRNAIEYIQSGRIGKVLMAKAWNVQMRRDIGRKPDSPVPPGVDYDTWVGPAPWLPFNENRFHYSWHWHWNYGTGDAGNDGAHQLDQARWALGVDFPTAAAGMGRKLFFQDDQQTPDTMVVTFNYPDKVLMFEMRIWNPYAMHSIENGVEVYGSEGLVRIGEWERAWGFKAFDRRGNEVHYEKEPPGGDRHVANFLDCVRNRTRPNADIETGHVSVVLCHLANIVARTGRSLKFYAANQTISGDPEVARLIRREYRNHWGTPKGI